MKLCPNTLLHWTFPLQTAVLWTWILLPLAGIGAETVRINEFMANNTRTLADQDGDYSDWIEIYNSGAQAVNLEGWYLTDDPELLTKWRFPSVNLGANGYLVVFASGKDRAVSGAPLHTSFSLDAAGEYLALVTADGATIASEFAPVFPPQFRDISYGVGTNGNAYFAQPTPGKANGTGYADYVADTKFDHDRGFYDAPLAVTITTTTTGAVIRYTTNGTPPTATAGIVYTAPISISGTTTLRAAGFKDGLLPSTVDTQTYLFLDDVIRQSPTGQAPPGWPTSWGSNVRDYGMDPDVVNKALYSGEIKNDLKSIPSFSIVMKLDDLFNSSTGIYANARQDGAAWERPCSVELIYPDGTKGFQINAGIRIRGGYSRSSDNPKHAFRLFFRADYGQPKLKYPLFGDKGASSFDDIDLRTFQNYSWSYGGDSRGVFIRDQFSRDSQLAMGQPGERGNYCHLYINGQYWGLYNTDERPEASYGETYFGGNKEDYDVVKVETDSYTIMATDGNMQAWTRLYNLCKAGLTNDAAYQKIQGNNPDGTPNPAYENLIDIDNLIDYMLVILYAGNLDAPISAFLGENNPNNWYGIRNRTGAFGGFRFFVHDAEHTLLNVNENRNGPWPAGNASVATSSPQWIWQKLQANAEFRLHVADHIQRHFFNGGLLTPEASRARFGARTNEIYGAVVGESARWGDSKQATPLTRANWLTEVNRIMGTYFAQRTGIVLNQLKAIKLYPNVAAASFSQQGGNVNPGFTLTMSAPAGAVYYTLDGSDPRLTGGSVAPGALTYSGAIPLQESVQVKSRVLAGGTWSALNAADFTIIQTFTNLFVTEIMYHPPARDGVDGDEFEFVELKNVSDQELDLSGVHFTNGIQFTFPRGFKLAPGRFVLLVSNASAFTLKYPNVKLDGLYTGRLSNGGETLTLVHAVGTPIFSVKYDGKNPWPLTPDGQDFSLVPINPNLNPDPNDPAHWRASSDIGGSPGADDPSLATPAVVINELLTHADPIEIDAIELYNPTSAPADISDWYLTDERSAPKKFRIPAPTVIPPGGYVVFTEKDFDPTPGVDPSFSFSSHGEEAYLYSADNAGNLTGYSDGFSFGAAENGVSFGRYTNSVGEIQHPAQIAQTFGAPNSGPRVGPIVINEINYDPAPGDEAFIELKNITSDAVKLYHPLQPTNTWELNGVGFVFPANLELAAKSLLLIVNTDPDSFRARHGVPSAVPVLGPYPAVLQKGGELLQLRKPDNLDVETNGTVVVPYITVDVVRYDDQAPWPTNAAGHGSSLERVNASTYGNDPANWRASFGRSSPGFENDSNRVPLVNAGPDQIFQSAVFPFSVTLAGTASDDGLPNPPGALTPVWTQADGPGPVTFGNPAQLNTTVVFPGVGSYTLHLTADDGAVRASDDVTFMLERSPAQVTLVRPGSVWKYLDDGSDQGTAWRAPAFNDTSWKSGPAQLGYGDGDEATVVGFGPNSNRKYVTTYFRRAFAVTNAASFTALAVKLLRDDGGIVYLNGTEVFRSAMPEGNVTAATLASTTVSGADETTNFYEQNVDTRLLAEGQNVLAVEIHQVNLTSTDISFDLELSGLSLPANQAPLVNAGNDQTITLPASATLKGTATDDGLPIPPGKPTITWTKFSGPGEVHFGATNALTTTADFTAPGMYTLRLTAEDGALSAYDDLNVEVTGPGEDLSSWKARYFSTAELAEPSISGDNADPDQDGFTNTQEFICGTDPKDPASYLKVISAIVNPTAASIRFQAVANKTYTVQYRDQVGGAWAKLTDIGAQPATDILVVIDTSAQGHSTRYYRLLTPQAP